MMEMVNIFSDLASTGTVAFEAADLPSLGVPSISAGSETTSTGDAVYAYRLVTLTVPKSGSRLYYTTDGNEPGFSDSDGTMVPDSSTTEYTAPFELKATDSAVTSTVKAMASKDGYVDSQVATASYTVNGTGETGTVITPPSMVSNVVLTQDAANPLQFSVSYDTQGTPKETVSWYMDTEATAAVDLDTDADSKTFTSDLLTEGRHQVMVKIAYTDGTESKTAFASKRFDVSQTAGPVLSLTEGVPQTVTLSSTTDGATMHYRYATGGDDPSGAYTEGTSFTVTSGVSLKVEAYAINYGLEASAVVSADYEPATTPIFSPSSATFTDSQEVTITSTTGSTIYYTTDGTTIPTTGSSSIASGESITLSETTTVKAIAVKEGMVNSATAEGTYKKLVYAIGDTGPAGGIIFYVNPNAATDGWTYLEAASADEPGLHVWGGYNILIGSTAQGRAIGTGKGNTTEIVLKYGIAEPYAGKTDYAAKLCYDKTVTNNGAEFDDWFLPSKDELNLMYTNKSAIEGFVSAWYLSSSEYDSCYAWVQNFSNGGQSYYGGNYTLGSVRAVRSF
ncbi:chitobiase/beta-hexosaminidase C-terminal domain-containing protein [uncultured Sphaerochaeta sp.]|uniref:chitobiase/beta-hexosaminidase C-terminal domain-containing protein n=1 Tax=uncultured Sphaerochaeta sp. TaxID=886478 RepID=UPI002A0A6533|nr:chitobiase/beta-hexosaminidase C-terminal domain-containing protein [uncultured Sphaerochaeta sp.]